MYKDRNLINWKKNIVFFLVSQSISQLGSSLVDYAIIWYITLETKSSILMALSMLFVFVPKILISFFAGIWADRYNRKKLIIYSDLSIGIVTLLFGIAFSCGFKDLWLIFTVLGIRSIGTGIQLPANKAILPLLIPHEKIFKINGINSSIESIINIISPAIGGVVLTYYTLDVIAYIDFITALLAVLILYRMRFSYEKINNLEKASYLKEVVTSFHYIKQNMIVRRLLIISITLIFLIIPLILLTPLKITRSFGSDVWRLSLYETIFGIGSILGGVLIALFLKIKHGYNIIYISFFIIGIACFSISSSNFVLVIISGFIIGIFISLASSTAMAILQKKTEIDYLGKIMGATQIMSNSFHLLGLVIFGVMGDFISINIIFILLGVSFIAYSGISFIYFKNRQYNI